MEPEASLRLLLLEDNLDDAELIRLELKKMGSPFILERVDTRDSFIDRLEKFSPDLILSDFTLPSFDGNSALELAKEKLPDVPVIFVSGTIGEVRAIEILKKGASDYILKDNILRLGPAVCRALQERDEIRRKRSLEEQTIRQNAILEGINEILIGVWHCETDADVARSFIAVAEKITESPAGFLIELIDDGSCRVIVTDGAGVNGGQSLPGGSNLTLEDTGISSIVKEVMSEGRPRILNGPIVESFAGGPLAIRELLAIPLSLHGKNFGMAGLANREGGYTVRHREALEMISPSFLEALFRKRAEIELARHRDHLQELVEEKTSRLAETHLELVETINRLEEEIEERRLLEDLLIHKNEELEAFAHRVSHELKNSLMSLKRIADLSVIEPDFVRNHSGLIAKQTGDLIDFVERMLQHARAGQAVMHIEVIPPSPMIREIFNTLKPQDMECELNIEEPIPSIPADTTALRQIFSNLIGNSIKHRDTGKEKVTIRISGTASDDAFTIVFRDNGPGIEEENLERIFDATYTTRTGDGFGFGLAINRKLVEAHGGRISAHSEGKGLGTEFKITFPRAQESASRG